MRRGKFSVQIIRGTFNHNLEARDKYIVFTYEIKTACVSEKQRENDFQNKKEKGRDKTYNFIRINTSNLRFENKKVLNKNDFGNYYYYVYYSISY